MNSPNAGNYYDGTRAYTSEITYSGRMHISRSALKGFLPNSTKYYVNPIWHGQGGSVKGKFWYTLPRRF